MPADPTPGRDALPAIIRALGAPDPQHQVCAIHSTVDAVAAAMHRAWDTTQGTPPQRFLEAVQAAGRELDRLARAVAEGAGRDESRAVDGIMRRDGPNDGGRPRERPAARRHACEPYRAGRLLLLGLVSVAFGLASLPGCVLLFVNPPQALLTLASFSLVGLPCGIAAWALAERDLRRMRSGLMGRAWLPWTEWALSAGRGGVKACVAGWAILIGVVAAIGIAYHIAVANGWRG
jgi:hypothetical protein